MIPGWHPSACPGLPRVSRHPAHSRPSRSRPRVPAASGRPGRAPAHPCAVTHQRKRSLSSGAGRAAQVSHVVAVTWGSAAARTGAAGWCPACGHARSPCRVPGRAGCGRVRGRPCLPGSSRPYVAQAGSAGPRGCAAACPDSVQPGWREVPGTGGAAQGGSRGHGAADDHAGSPSPSAGRWSLRAPAYPGARVKLLVRQPPPAVRGPGGRRRRRPGPSPRRARS